MKGAIEKIIALKSDDKATKKRTAVSELQWVSDATVAQLADKGHDFFGTPLYVLKGYLDYGAGAYMIILNRAERDLCK